MEGRNTMSKRTGLIFTLVEIVLTLDLILLPLYFMHLIPLMAIVITTLVLYTMILVEDIVDKVLTYKRRKE